MSDDRPDDTDVVDLAEYRRSREQDVRSSSARTWKFRAVGRDQVVIDVLRDGEVVETHEFSGKNVEYLGRATERAVRAARAWDVPRCPAPGCERRWCATWHDGLVVRADYNKGKVYRVDGRTKRGRARLRPVGGGSILYVSGGRDIRRYVVLGHGLVEL